MSVRIRLRRMGKKKQPHYRIVVADSRSPRDGRFVENLGYYNPLKHPDGFKVDIDRVDYWLGEGAIPSPTVKSLVAHAREVAAQADDGGAEGEDAPDAKAQEAATAQAPQADDGGAKAAAAAEPDEAAKAEAKGDAGGEDAPDAEAQPATTANAKSEVGQEGAPDADVAPDDDAGDAAAETTAAEADKVAAETDGTADEAGAAAAKDGKASADEAPDEASAEDASKA